MFDRQSVLKSLKEDDDDDDGDDDEEETEEKAKDAAAEENVKATLAEVAVARDQGYYQSGGLATPGHGVIAMLLPSSLRGQRMALGVGARLDRLQLRKREYIDRLSEAIAHC